MKPAKRIKLVLFIVLITFFGCSDDDSVALEELSKAYVDLLVVEDFYKDTDSLEQKRDQVFNKYSITESIYDSSFKKFEHDSEKWEKFFELSNAYLDSLKNDFTPVKKPKPQRLP